MKIEDITNYIANNTQLAICEADGKLHYIGSAQVTRTFNELEIERINVVNNQLIITILTNDMLY